MEHEHKEENTSIDHHPSHIEIIFEWLRWYLSSEHWFGDIKAAYDDKLTEVEIWKKEKQTYIDFADYMRDNNPKTWKRWQNGEIEYPAKKDKPANWCSLRLTNLLLTCVTAAIFLVVAVIINVSQNPQ